MPKEAQLPAEVTDHFSKANVLHTYVQQNLGEATKHALETGRELLAAKAAIPHGSWEEKCERLFDGSLRTAQFYMKFAKDFGALPKAQKSAVLLLEGTLDGAAKAARKAAKPPSGGAGARRAPPKAGQRAAEEPEQPDLGKCPVCGGTKWDEDDDGHSCSKCHHPHGEPAGDVDEDRIKTQRQKTVKTVEALIRAFDDLHGMKAREEHGGATRWLADDVLTTVKDMGAIAACKGLLKIAKAWR